MSSLWWGQACGSPEIEGRDVCRVMRERRSPCSRTLPGLLAPRQIKESGRCEVQVCIPGRDGFVPRASQTLIKA